MTKENQDSVGESFVYFVRQKAYVVGCLSARETNPPRRRDRNHEAMSKETQFREALLASWQTNNRVTSFLVENLAEELWPMKVPGAPRRTVRMIAGHVHNVRCMWIKMLGKASGISIPQRVDRHRVTQAELIPALAQSNQGIVELIETAVARGGTLPHVAWLNLPADIVHFVAYLVAHEAHHRGQIVMLARQLGHRLPQEVTNGLWQWLKRAREVQD